MVILETSHKAFGGYAHQQRSMSPVDAACQTASMSQYVLAKEG
jgi:hypothetical protein